MAPKRRVLGWRSQAQRKQARQKLGSLRYNRVKGTTIPRYLFAVGEFLLWLNLWVIPLACSMQEMDHQLQDFLEYLWESGSSKGVANDALSGVQW